ncbi:hypothetical protein NECAME_06741 [Necator americanus]|uniref:Uncharacterized protein n=1 Tax=Necator americanus TaxID=51031 RepID=W2TUE4_NECAM|nr:hypothetical protein NECAME_06741 [Necator americanus]ETN84711.1 hypothetical protein NECAME_06741 [Necator americanus]
MREMVKDCPPDRRPNDTFQIALRAAVTAVGGGEYEPVPARTAMVGGEREEAAGKKKHPSLASSVRGGEGAVRNRVREKYKATPAANRTRSFRWRRRPKSDQDGDQEVISRSRFK